MKQFQLFFVVLFFSQINFAQISVTADDFRAQLELGKTVTTYNDRVTTSIDLGTTGSTSWDFVGLVATDEFVTESKAVASSPYASDFPTAQYASNYQGTFEGTFSNTWVHNSIGNDFITHGTGTVANSVAGDVTTLITFGSDWNQYKLPVVFGGTWSYAAQQTIATTITVPFVGPITTTIQQQRTISYLVDAYGTVTMPDGKNLSALRIREENHLVGEGVDQNMVIYHILTKTGESVSITLAQGLTDNSGVVNIDAISWTTGDGIDSPPIVTVTAPSALIATAATNSIDLTWTDASNNEDGFRIERSVSGASQYSQIAEVSSGTTSYSDNSAQPGTNYSYRVAAYLGNTVSAFSNESSAMIAVTSLESGDSLPADFTLEQNYPNPFNPSTRINFTLPFSGHTLLKVYDSLGKEIAILVNESLNRGSYSINFSAEALSSGIYYYSLTSGNFIETRKMLLIK
ncbi:MAG: T9SS type A sorting domain-containing protein [Bacteroidetes bacterium]|nr:T9SS type A sorting domain-containing protein [Bacteroidota bacterium]